MSMPFASDARHRPPYEAELPALLADRFALDGSQTVLDLGASSARPDGPGALALSLAAVVDHVYAVHPEPDVLAEGARLAEERGRSNISWLEGDASAVTRLCLPRIDLCVIGDAFHRTDRDRLPADLDTLLAPRGGLALIAAPDDLEDLTDRLAKSAFSRIETTTWDRPVAVTVIVATRPVR
ncbi:class I SAM-dependent methyltransferase [Streptomyces sp. NPDC059874]|uniref:class I SAM-dependent methyltransferase n=1 Tax=Streptomyces sp. NPDC059874 TaxID=3346983 RepID=UPI003650001F